MLDWSICSESVQQKTELARLDCLIVPDQVDCADDTEAINHYPRFENGRGTELRPNENTELMVCFFL